MRNLGGICRNRRLLCEEHLAMMMGMIGAVGAAGGGLTWQTTFSQALGTDSTGWQGFNLRQWINSSLLSVSGSNVRLTLQAHSAAPCTIGDIYIGHQAAAGDAYDFDGNQAQIKVAGSGSFTITSGSSVVTDSAVFSLDKTKNLIVAVYFSIGSASSVSSANAVSNVAAYFTSGADEASVSNAASGYNGAGNNILELINKIEVA